MAVRCGSATASWSYSRPTEDSFFEFGLKRWLLKHNLSTMNDLQTVWGDWVCWLWRKLGLCVVTKWQLGALAQLRVQVSQVHRGQFFECGLKRWLLKHYLSVVSDLQHVWSGLLSWLWRKMRWRDFETALRGFRALGLLSALRPTGGSFWSLGWSHGCSSISWVW